MNHMDEHKKKVLCEYEEGIDHVPLVDIIAKYYFQSQIKHKNKEVVKQ